jgi:hypothetical protein
MTQYLREYISESALDDLESWQTLKTDVTTWAQEEGRRFSDEEFARALESLVREGKMRAFQLDSSNNQFHSIVDFDSLGSQLESYWFKTKREESR